MRILTTVFLLAYLWTLPLLAQHEDDHQHTQKCGTMPYLEAMKAADPGLEQRMEELDRATIQWVLKNGGKLKKTNDIVTIPVVFHVVYANASQNVSDAQINSQLDVLNKDFRRLNSDTSNTPAVFKSLGADVEVEFCLASLDPQGNFTSGITRTATTNTNFTTSNNAVKFNVSGGKNVWDRDSYLNIWVCKIQGGVLGYAQFPAGNAATDGVVIDYQALGTTGAAQYPFNKGRTATHEIGHWLNLRHIWGDDGNACTGSDYVNDTPNQGDEYYGCPSFPQTSCSSQDMFMNYMDYSNDNCLNIFTIGQRDRMLAALNLWRSGLLSSPGCVTQPPVAHFSVDNMMTVPGCGVNFTNLSTGAVQNYQWIFEGGTPGTSTSVSPQNISFDQVGQWDVHLIVSNLMGSDTLTMTDYITVSDTLLPVPAFSSSKRIPCAGEIITFSDESTSCPSAWNWVFQPSSVSYHNGTTAASAVPEVSFDTPGKYTVQLDVTNINGQRSHQKTDLIISGGLDLPYLELFEEGSLGNQEWTLDNPNGDFSWEIVTAPSYLADNKAVVISIHGTNSLGYRDRLISAPLNLTKFAEAYVMFKHAYAQYQAGYSDSLIVLVSEDCGSTWTRVFAAGEDGNGSFATHSSTTAKFVPASADDWCGGSFGSPCNGIDISAWAGKNDIRIAFESFSFISNNIYLDDIRVSNVLQRNRSLESNAQLSIYPNPSTGEMTLTWKNLSGKFTLRINNLQGQTVYEDNIQLTDDNYLGLDISEFPAGVYLMNLVGDSQVVSRKLILR